MNDWHFWRFVPRGTEENVYKVLNCVHDVTATEGIFTIDERSSRGNPGKWITRKSRTCLRSGFFTIAAINDWNWLPESVISSVHINFNAGSNRGWINTGKTTSRIHPLSNDELEFQRKSWSTEAEQPLDQKLPVYMWNGKTSHCTVQNKNSLTSWPFRSI